MNGRSYSGLVRFLVLAATVWSQGQAEEKTIHHSDDMREYTMRFDTARVAGLDMMAISWLSPFSDDDYKMPFMAAGSVHGDIYDKVFTVPSLEGSAPRFSIEKEASSRESSPFLKRAERALVYGRFEIATLRAQKLPPVLQPVREYLLRYLEFDLRRSERRFSYIKDGDPARPIQLLCEYCPCQPAAYKDVIAELNGASDEASRIDATHSWLNAVLHCYTARSGTYPVAVWKKFLLEFGVSESLHYKRID